MDTKFDSEPQHLNLTLPLTLSKCSNLQRESVKGQLCSGTREIAKVTVKSFTHGVGPLGIQIQRL